MTQSSAESRKSDGEDSAASIALVKELALVPVHDCLLYEGPQQGFDPSCRFTLSQARQL